MNARFLVFADYSLKEFVCLSTAIAYFEVAFSIWAFKQKFIAFITKAAAQTFLSLNITTVATRNSIKRDFSNRVFVHQKLIRILTKLDVSEHFVFKILPEHF